MGFWIFILQATTQSVLLVQQMVTMYVAPCMTALGSWWTRGETSREVWAPNTQSAQTDLSSQRVLPSWDLPHLLSPCRTPTARVAWPHDLHTHHGRPHPVVGRTHCPHRTIHITQRKFRMEGRREGGQCRKDLYNLKHRRNPVFPRMFFSPLQKGNLESKLMKFIGKWGRNVCILSLWLRQSSPETLVSVTLGSNGLPGRKTGTSWGSYLFERAKESKTECTSGVRGRGRCRRPTEWGAWCWVWSLESRSLTWAEGRRLTH